MRHAPTLLAPLLLGALLLAGNHAADASSPTSDGAGATAPAPAASPERSDEILETPAQPDEPLYADDEDAPGPSFSNLVSFRGDLALLTPPARPLADDPPSEEKTPRPTKEEWKDASEVKPSRMAETCSAKRVREWLRISCRTWGELAAMDLLAGQSEGVSFETHPGTFVQSEHVVVMPLRRGDRRVIQIVRVSSASKYSIDYDTAATISEDWLAEAPAPTVVVD